VVVESGGRGWEWLWVDQSVVPSADRSDGLASLRGSMSAVWRADAKVGELVAMRDIELVAKLVVWKVVLLALQMALSRADGKVAPMAVSRVLITVEWSVEMKVVKWVGQLGGSRAASLAAWSDAQLADGKVELREKAKAETMIVLKTALTVG